MEEILRGMGSRPLMTVQRFLKMCIVYGILSSTEAVTALTTGLLPDDIMDRIKCMGKKISN